MIVLIIGYGSAGRRHARVLNNLFKVKKIFIKTKQKISNQKKLIFINKIENLDPDLIVVANETNKHLKTCLFLEKKFKKKIIIIEKPLFNKFYNFKPQANQFFVAYNLRFHPILKYLKQKLKNKNPFYIEAESSSFLPHWRQNIDYKKSYSAFKAKGGGTILDLSHEIDYILYLFEKFRIKNIYSKKISDLKISSDDFSLIFGKINIKSFIKIKLSYFQLKSCRKLSIFFKNGNQIYADLINSKLEIYTQKKKKTIIFKKNNQDFTTLNFYKNIFLKKKYACSLTEGLNLLKQLNVKNIKKLT